MPSEATAKPSHGSDHAHSSASAKQHRSSVSKRLTGRLPDRPPSLHSRPSLNSLGTSGQVGSRKGQDAAAEDPSDLGSHGSGSRNANEILARVAQWLDKERHKRQTGISRRHAVHSTVKHAAEATKDLAHGLKSHDESHGRHSRRRDSDLAETSVSLDELQKILAETMESSGVEDHYFGDSKMSGSLTRRLSKRKGSRTLLRRGSTTLTSDTEHPDNEMLVPSVEASLDNTKTLGMSSNLKNSQGNLLAAEKRMVREQEAWRQFKTDVLTLTHTLQVSGWRKVPMEQSSNIDVQRLSGALTNAVYVVTPPKDLGSNLAADVDGRRVSSARKLPKYIVDQTHRTWAD